MMTGCDEWGERERRTLIEVEAALAVIRADGDERPDILCTEVTASASRRARGERERERGGRGAKMTKAIGTARHVGQEGRRRVSSQCRSLQGEEHRLTL